METKNYYGSITKPNTSNTELIIFCDTLPLTDEMWEQNN